MHVIKTVLFDHDETRTLARAQSLIDIAYPPASDPLVPRDRAVADDDPRRRALLGLTAAYDPVGWSRLTLAHEVLAALADQIVAESEVSYWLAFAAEPVTDQAFGMAQALAAERTGQTRLVAEALDLVTGALAHLTEADDPRTIRDAERWT